MNTLYQIGHESLSSAQTQPQAIQLPISKDHFSARSIKPNNSLSDGHFSQKDSFKPQQAYKNQSMAIMHAKNKSSTIVNRINLPASGHHQTNPANSRLQ